MPTLPIDLRERIRIGLLAIALGSILVLCTLAMYGTLHIFTLTVHSPLPLEQAVGACFVLLTLAPPPGPPEKPSQTAWTTPMLRVAIPAIALLVILSYSRNLSDPFLSDDYILVSRATLKPSAIIWPFTHPGGDGSYRPIGYLYFALVGAAARANPWAWHACSLAIHLANCLMLYWLSREIWDDTRAGVSIMLVFGLWAAHPEVVVWTAGTFDLLSCFFFLAAAVCIFRPGSGRIAKYHTALVPILTALAIWTKESAYPLAIVASVLAWAVDSMKVPILRRRLSLAFLTSGALLLFRLALFHGPGGYLDPSTGRPAILSLSPLESLKALFWRLSALLLFPIDWDWTRGVHLSAAVGVFASVCVYLAWRNSPSNSRVPTSLLASTLVLLMPALHLALVGASLAGARVLYMPSVTFAALVGSQLAQYRRRTAAIAVYGTVTVGMWLGLSHNLGAWHAVADAADRFCTLAASSTDKREDLGRSAPTTVHGVFFFANGLPECVDLKRRDVVQR